MYMCIIHTYTCVYIVHVCNSSEKLRGHESEGKGDGHVGGFKERKGMEKY